DEAAFESAGQCLGKLRRAFGGRFLATIGDHEIGKKMLAADEGGLRLGSYHRACRELGLPALWKHEVGNYLLVGITSTLAAFPIYEAEALLEERADWRRARAAHMEELGRLLASVTPSQRLLLFCHDPSALPFLWQEDFVRAKTPQ